MASPFCALLRTKTAYYRTPDGDRIFKPDDSTACYTCLKTQRPVGPDARRCASVRRGSRMLRAGVKK
jgi:hypothetical protein